MNLSSDPAYLTINEDAGKYLMVAKENLRVGTFGDDILVFGLGIETIHRNKASSSFGFWFSLFASVLIYCWRYSWILLF